MAIYHCRLKLVSRGCGQRAKARGISRRSVVAAAAYRAGERLYDATLGQWFSYDRKRHIVHTEIMVPSTGAAMPWARDRQALWNAVERAEGRVDAQLAREVELTLPRELELDQQVALVRGFVQENFVAEGMVADFSIHAPKAADGKAQPHAHILLTLRPIDPGTETGFAANKNRDWNERPEIAKACNEARKRYNNTCLPEDKEALEAIEAQRNINVWRKSWADLCNRALAEAGSDARIDHRTLEKQGIFRLPQIPLGIARHIQKSYDYIRERVTHWVGLRKRASLEADAAHLAQRDPAQLADFVLKLGEIAEAFTAGFRHRPKDKPEPNHER